MSASKDPQAYPAAFSMLLDHFVKAEAQPIRQFYPRAADAAKLRFTFYNFKRALRNSGDQQRLLAANGIVIRLIDHPQGGASLEFSLRDNEDYALELEAAIAAAASRFSGADSGGAGAGDTADEAASLTSDEVTEAYLRRGQSS